MTNRFEQKKEYTAPTMEIIEVKHQNALLDCSQCSDPDDSVTVDLIK
jgi:hypothetical protein